MDYETPVQSSVLLQGFQPLQVGRRNGCGELDLSMTQEQTGNETMKSKYGLSSGNQNTMKLVDGRVPAALPEMLCIKEDSELLKFQDSLSDPNNYGPRSDLPAWNKYGTIKFEKSIGRYVDAVFDDGTVIPFILSDVKGNHLGSSSSSTYNKDWAYDIESKGWCQLTYNNTGVGASGGKGNTITSRKIFEPWWGINNLIKAVKGKKLVGFRVYNVTMPENNWNEVFKNGGGTDTSFGLTGGSTTGTATLDGSSVRGTGNNYDPSP